MALEKPFGDSGYPTGLYSNLFADVDTTGRVIDHPLVRGVSLTGSVRAGRAVAARAWAALKKCVLELGGSDASIILSDADLDAAASSCVAGRLVNSGQSCVADEADAVRVANDTVFGLGAAVYTRDLDRGEQIAADLLDAGNCFVNTVVKSDPRLPFGGIKQSGYGRELGPFGLREFTNVKTVWVE